MVNIELHTCASENRVDILKYLLDQKGVGKEDLEAKNLHGETALHAAARNGCDEAVKMLIDYGACVEARTNNSKTPLHLAVDYAVISGQLTVVKTLLEYQVDRSPKDNNGWTPVRSILEAGLQDKKLLRLVYQNNDINRNPVNEINKKRGSENLEEPNENPVDQVNKKSCSEAKNDGSGIKGKMDDFEDELSNIVGLHELKLQFTTWAKGFLMDEKRRAVGMKLGPRKQPHMVFLGNPGTGKTTVARILGKLLKSVGVLSSDKVIEVQRTDLVGEHIGQTGPKARKKIEEAMGSTLFVDEAYRLVPTKETSGHKDFGVEALEEIMSVLEDGNIVVVFAGYTEPMKRVFSSNEGFCRRVTHFFQFDDFTCKYLAEMLMLKMSKQNEKSRLYGFKLHPSCTCDAVLQVIENNSSEKLRNKMNGGLVDHMLNNARENLDLRLNFDSQGDELCTITLTDLEAGLRKLSRTAECRLKETRTNGDG
ncbi:hypothetical protein ABFS82_10G104100 [Erythranthe guttata]|uniref:protein cfxQ homolog n=1 Tax=Erythranthe guttata TaxID=4155 RepID=UPI00064DFA80|nr:PREDICTED: protein cfxQ homolog [Erythranthe guttata]|eukprot:XP_012849535.1 PREDICTED: protein cfxQ homolog [Erythranthe guttata]